MHKTIKKIYYKHKLKLWNKKKKILTNKTKIQKKKQKKCNNKQKKFKILINNNCILKILMKSNSIMLDYQNKIFPD